MFFFFIEMTTAIKFVVLFFQFGKDGLGFCVELCARALQTDVRNDPVAKSLIYKTIACLLPNDLEVCRACALLVFFLERTVESYKNVFLLYTHPDQSTMQTPVLWVTVYALRFSRS